MLSIVVPCSGDARLEGCLASIDAPDAEVVLSLNGATRQVSRIARRFAASRPRVVVVELPRPNLAEALEAGCRAAAGDRLLFMDSDCRFTRGAIRRMDAAADEHAVVKGHIVFESDSVTSRVIARTREHHTADVLTAYKPPLLLHASLVGRIGGYFFDARLRWREDSDLDARIRRAGIPIHGEPAAVIHHPALTVVEDCRSAFRYGVGLARARRLRVTLTEVPRSVLSTARRKGLLAGVYMCLRNACYHLGTLIEWARMLGAGPSDA
jgi:glycosyltransferase involved in cell wall biosynthesis